jgi:hypothetical protein
MVTLIHQGRRESPMIRTAPALRNDHHRDVNFGEGLRCRPLDGPGAGGGPAGLR